MLAMWIIDRYLLGQFLKTFLICFVSLTGLFIVIDAFSNLEDFIRAADKYGGMMAAMASYYGYRSIWFFDRMAGLLTLISAMFTMAWIQRHQEMTALMAAGFSRARVVAPVLAASIVILLGAAVNREVVIPRCRAELTRWPRDLAGNTVREMQYRYDNQTDVLFRGKAALVDQQKIERPDFLLPVTLSDYGSQVVAAEAWRLPAEGERPAGFLMRGVEEPKNLDQRPTLSLGERPVLITPRDAPDWLQPDECFIVSSVTFDQLSDGAGFRDFSSLVELVRGLRNPSLEFGADVRVAIHARIVQPLLDLTLLMLGLPMVIARESRNVFVAIGMSAGVVSVFSLVVITLQQLGAASLLTPALAAWSPLIVFVPLAVYLAEPLWE